jgi:hypothetical protein
MSEKYCIGLGWGRNQSHNKDIFWQIPDFRRKVHTAQNYSTARNNLSYMQYMSNS